MKLSQAIASFVDLFYIAPVRALVSRQTFRYGVCGGANLLLDSFLYWTIIHFVVRGRFIDLGFAVMSPHIATLFVVFPITFFNGFWLNKNVAFRRSPLRSRTQLMRYALSVAGSIVLSYICMKILVEACGIYPTPSKLVTSLITVLYSYLMQKHFTFRGSSEE